MPRRAAFLYRFDSSFYQALVFGILVDFVGYDHRVIATRERVLDDSVSHRRHKRALESLDLLPVMRIVDRPARRSKLFVFYQKYKGLIDADLVADSKEKGAQSVIVIEIELCKRLFRDEGIKQNACRHPRTKEAKTNNPRSGVH